MMEAAPAKRRIAFFGGSFDPPHLGHIGIARAAQQLLNFDSILFTPVGNQPLKPSGSTASYEDRVAMTELAIQGLPQFAISFADAPDPTGAPNYTIDTLLRLRQQYPSAELFNLMGADSFLSLRRWYRAAELPFVAPLVIATRPGQPVDDLASVLPDGVTTDQLPAPMNERRQILTRTVRNSQGETAPVYLLVGLQIEISATEIRHQAGTALDRLCAGHDLLPRAVCDYIAAHRLYDLA
jgi:nicotinate-nucleotide adenylyltransferase